MNYPFFIYFHIAAIGRYQEVVLDMYNMISTSGILEAVTECRCFITGPKHNTDWVVSNFTHPKCKIMANNEDVTSYERFTLDRMYQHCHESPIPFKVLYLHSKGVSKKNPQQATVSDLWRKLMMRMLVGHYTLCLHHLENLETVGCMYVSEPLPHYAGNFWWANSAYIRSLPKIRYPLIYYIDCELWIGLNMQNSASLYQLESGKTIEQFFLSMNPLSIQLLQPTFYIGASKYSSTQSNWNNNIGNANKILINLGYESFELRNHGLCFDLSHSDIVRVIYNYPPRLFAMTGDDIMTLFPSLFYRNY